METSELLFRGMFSLRIPFKVIQTVEAKSGQLHVAWAQGSTSFALGKDAEKWALKIRYPRGRLEKLGVKEGMRVVVLGVDDAAFRDELRGRVPDFADGRAKKQSDIINFVRNGWQWCNAQQQSILLSSILV